MFKALIGMGSMGYSEMRAEQQKGFVPPSYRQISTIRPVLILLKNLSDCEFTRNAGPKRKAKGPLGLAEISGHMFTKSIV